MRTPESPSPLLLRNNGKPNELLLDPDTPAGLARVGLLDSVEPPEGGAITVDCPESTASRGTQQLHISPPLQRSRGRFPLKIQLTLNSQPYVFAWYVHEPGMAGNK